VLQFVAESVAYALYVDISCVYWTNYVLWMVETVWNHLRFKVVTKHVHYIITIGSWGFITGSFEVVIIWFTVLEDGISTLTSGHVPFLWVWVAAFLAVSPCEWPTPLPIHFNLEDGCSVCLWNVGIHLQHCMASEFKAAIWTLYWCLYFRNHIYWNM
jgi:hypothetical protein